jgi:hypothetical protein
MAQWWTEWRAGQLRHPITRFPDMTRRASALRQHKLAKSFEGPADGMYARLLFSWPSEPVYRKLTDAALEVDPEILNALKRLDSLAEFADDRLVRHPLPLSEDALVEFEQFRRFAHLEREAAEGRDREWLAKGPAHVLRLAGTLCLLDWAMRGGAVPTVVDVDFASAAVRLVKEYFWPHARAALRQIGLTERHANARRVLRWARARGLTEISREGVRRDALAQRLDAEQAFNLLEALKRAGWVREKAPEPGPQGGRPPLRWEVNPNLFLAAETAEIAQTPPAAPAADLWPEVSAVSAVSARKTENRENGGAAPYTDGAMVDGAASRSIATADNQIS